MIDLSGELSHVMKNGSITANLTPRNSDSFLVNLIVKKKKKRFAPKQCNVSGGILKVWFTGSLFQTSVHSMRIFILYNWNEFVKFWYGDIQRKLTEIGFSCSRSMRDSLLHEQTWEKFRNYEESSCYHTQNTALIFHLYTTICFDPWPICCVDEISRKHWSCGSGANRILRIKSQIEYWYRLGIIILA